MKYNINTLFFVLLASILYLVFSAQPAEALPLEIPELKAKFQAIHHEIVDFSKHSSLIELVKRRGGSSGGRGSSSSSSGASKGGSSSGSKGGSSSGSSSGGRGSSTSSSAAGSVSSLRSGRYGGSPSLFPAGLATGLGLGALLILASSAHSHYPGNWGVNGVYSYKYNTTLNGTNYDVTCYCMQYNPCSCEKVETQEYFENLPSNISRTSTHDNVTFVYINGTSENVTSASTTSAKNGAISSFRSNIGSGSLLALSIATISMLI